MMTIKLLSKDIECNIKEAEDKIDTAYRLRSEHPNMALWYRDMAQMHLNFNTKGHDLVNAEIQTYRGSTDYAEHPEYADGMMAVWNDKHADIMAHNARVKAMIDAFK